jgi:hypothetical protein
MGLCACSRRETTICLSSHGCSCWVGDKQHKQRIMQHMHSCCLHKEGTVQGQTQSPLQSKTLLSGHITLLGPRPSQQQYMQAVHKENAPSNSQVNANIC